MRIRLAYGRRGLPVELPDDTHVVRAVPVAGLPNEQAALREAIRNPIGCPPLASLVGRGDKVVVVHTDITRATPNNRILPAILQELESARAARKDITLLNALGTHRPQTRKELVAMLGEDIVRNYRCVQHDANNDACLVSVGKTKNGHPARVNRPYMEADIRILTGFIAPHFFAGFSGGPKAVLPGIAGAESVLTNHGAKMISRTKATWGITKNNPIWEESMEIALRTRPTFILNVTMNPQNEITGVFAGDLAKAHRAGCEFVKKHCLVSVDEPFDVVVTGNSGYPLDQNLYQCVKGMSAAAGIARKGGAIVIAGACADGLPDHGRYADLLSKAGSPRSVMDMVHEPGFSESDQWQAQIQAMIQLKTDVYVYSDGLSDDQIRRALLIPCRDIATTVASLRRKHGPRVCVMPDGPHAIARIG